MAVTRTNPNYPDTSTRGPETPIGVLVRKVDKNYDRDRARDLAYKFTRRKFIEDPLAHGAYLVTGNILDVTGDFAPSDFLPGDFVTGGTAQQSLNQNGHDYPAGPDPMEGAVYKGT